MLSTRRVLAALVLTAAAMGVLNLAPGLPHGDLHWATARAHLRAETGALWVPPACCCLYMLAAPTRLPSHAHAVVGGRRTAGQLLGRWQGSPLRWHLHGRPSPVWRAGERLPQSQLTDSQPPAHIHGDDLRQAPSSSRCCLMPTPVQLPCGHPPPPCGAAGAAALWPTLPCLPLLLLLLPLAQRVPTQQARGRGRTLSAASLSE